MMPTPALCFALTIWLAFALSSIVARPSSTDQQQQQSQPVLKTLSQEIGSPSELAWQAWLLVESKGGISSALDSSNILRRITPKSIFIAPELISCPSGYSTDGKGSCRPDPISIDEAAQKQFFLKRLNAIYGKFGANKKRPEQQQSPPQPQGGPLQINIPISLPVKNPQVESIPVLLATEQQPSVIVTGANHNKTPEAVAVVVYKVGNDTRKDDSSSEPFLLGGANTSKKVAEIIVEANDTITTGVVDYKIPARRPNTTSIGHQQQQQQQQSDKKHNNDESSEDSSPTVVLLLSPTKLPFTTTIANTTEKFKVSSQHEQQQEEIISTEETRTTETSTLPTTIIIDETRFETIQTVAPLDLETDDVRDTTTFGTPPPPNTRSSTDDYEQHRDQQQMMTTTTLLPSTIDDETVSYTDGDDEEAAAAVAEETQTPEQKSENDDDDDDEDEEEEAEYEDELAEDELLKPGEAGMLMSAMNQELIRSKTHTSTIPTTTTTTMMQDTTTISPTVDIIYDTKESSTIGGFTAQTTEVASTIANTIPPIVVVDETTTTTTTTPTPQPQKVKATIQINPYAETRRQPPTTTFRTTDNPTEPPPSFLLQRQTQQQQQQHKPPSFTVNDEPPIFFKDDTRRDNLPPEFKDQLSRDRTTFVRFPESLQKPSQHNQNQRGFVKFPSDDVNSIHTHQDSLKDLSPFQYSSSTKSSVQRWRQQKPMLLRFWARMPLVRDLTFYPTTSHGSHNEPIGGEGGGGGGSSSTAPTTSRRAATSGSIYKSEA